MTLSGYTPPEERMTENDLNILWAKQGYPSNNKLYNWLVSNNRPYGTMSKQRFAKLMRKIRLENNICPHYGSILGENNVK